MDEDGSSEIAIFSGPDARERAIRYADREYGAFDEIELEPYRRPTCAPRPAQAAGRREAAVAPFVRTKDEQHMPGNPREMITMAERRFPVRIRLGVPPGGLGQRYTQITAWLDENCGADGWTVTPSGTRGVLNDAISIYFADATLASAFVARWCVGSKIETAGGVFQVREDEPAPRVGSGLHRTP